MKVLWLVNILMPEAAELLNIKGSVGGGWLIGLHNDIKNKMNLVICCPCDSSTSGSVESKSSKYYTFRRNVSSIVDEDTKNDFITILKDEKPDVIHIWGTEYLHSYEMYQAAESLGVKDKVVVSIQGMVSVYAQHFAAGLSEKIMRHKTLREWLKGDNLNAMMRDYEKRGEYEIALIKSVHNVIGRTDWDRACVYGINSDVVYWHCNETLRKSFYEHEWEYSKCKKHSIFFTQCNVPLKGFHTLLQAMPYILRYYPDTEICITGSLKSASDDLKNKMGARTYDKYISDMMKKLDLQGKVHFLGSLSEKEMCEQYLKANAFVLASSIENSPNSLGEAMLLGVPVVSSFVGGVQSMISHGSEGYLFDVNAPYMLAYYVCKIFSMGDQVSSMCSAAREHAMITHSHEKNVNDLIDIYMSINKEQ